MRLRFLGCGDAFGSGGRLQACLLLSSAGGSLLLDCGATALVAMRRFGVDPNGIGAIVLTHLHGDHFGGIPFFVLDAQLVSKRSEPLLVAGPPGTKERVFSAMEALFPGSSTSSKRFELSFMELPERRPRAVGAATATAFPAVHPSGAPSTSVRIEMDGATLAYTGDTEWNPALPELSRGADLLVAEGYTYDKKVKFHLDAATLVAESAGLGAKKIILTHLGPEALERRSELPFEAAEDGLELEL